MTTDTTDTASAPPSPPVRSIRLGRILATPAALVTFDSSEIRQALSLHASGNWGQMDAEDMAANDRVADAIAAGDPDPGRLFSSYLFRGQKLWIITDGPAAPCPITTALLPDDY